MAGINPIGGAGPVWPTSGAGGVGGVGGLSQPDQSGQTKADFAKMLKTYIGEVDGKQQASYDAVKDLIAGKAQDIMPVVNAVAQADMSFKLLMGVRNKMIDAYKQTMNMQV
jgi:flagellar hook-basal body complex protein FliE